MEQNSFHNVTQDKHKTGQVNQPQEKTVGQAEISLGGIGMITAVIFLN